MRKHLLVTNDFPPKIGGIQNYLWELWRRLPPQTASVYTTPYAGTAEFDTEQPFYVKRSPEPFLIPYPWLVGRIDSIARETASELVILDPAIPLGALGPNLRLPIAVVLHGAEVTIPGRVPILRSIMARTLRASSLVVSAGRYALSEAERCAGRSLPSVIIPPGVDIDRFQPLDPDDRLAARRRLGIDPGAFLIASVNRLVPRKGMDRLIRAVALTRQRRRAGSRAGGSSDEVQVVVAGVGRDARRLKRLAASLRAPVHLPGRLSDDDVADLYGAADLMVMPCNSRWLGLEQEGFGIAFLEAAAAGIPQIAGRSGGAHEAVDHRRTGLILDNPDDIEALARSIEFMIDNPVERRRMGHAARLRAVEEFNYDYLAKQLGDALATCELRRPGGNPGR